MKRTRIGAHLAINGMVVPAWRPK